MRCVDGLSCRGFIRAYAAHKAPRSPKPKRSTRAVANQQTRVSGALKRVVLALAAFMIYAVWPFPEGKERKDNGA